jgi:hypothetical protein
MREYTEYMGIQSGDKIIDARVVKTLKQLSKEPSASIQSSCGDPHQSKAVYRLLRNEKFKPEQVTKVHAAESAQKIQSSGAKIVLIPQDTSEVHYTNLQATTGLGHIRNNETSRGLLLHNALAIGENNEIYGLLGQTVIVRESGSYGKKHQRK